MLNLLLPMMANLIKDLVVSEAQSLAAHHVREAINRNLSDDAKEILNMAISSDKSHDKEDIDSLIDDKCDEH